jgi:hypothetical protein
MNYYEERIIKRYGMFKNGINGYRTNICLLHAISAIELVHRNLVWRIIEYFVFLVTPISYSKGNLLTIGKLQIKVQYLKEPRKIKYIIKSNNLRTLDDLLYKKFPSINWSLLEKKDIDTIVKYYNGDRTEKYSRMIQKLLLIK